jgi:hypothetical protein
MRLLPWAMFALFSASAANAVTFTSVAGNAAPAPGESLVVSFDSPNAPGYQWTSGVLGTAIGSSNKAATPAGNTSRYGYVSSALSANNATLATPSLKSISLYWGSIDKYNHLDVLGLGDSVLLTISGGMLPPANGDRGAAITNRRVFITAGPNEVIRGLRFRSTGVAYEFDSIAAAAVPEPQAWMMLVAGFGMVGFAVRRRQRAVTAA